MILHFLNTLIKLSMAYQISAQNGNLGTIDQLIVGTLYTSSFVPFNIILDNDENSYGPGSGALQISGGAWIGKDLVVDDDLTIYGAVV